MASKLEFIPQGLLDAYDDLHLLPCFKERESEFYRIIVVGDQSVGKTTLLEAIAQDRIKLPKGSTGQPVTRTPITIQLRAAKVGEKPFCRLKVEGQEQTLKDGSDAAEIQKMYETSLTRLGVEPTEIKMDMEDITLAACMEGLPNLTLVDLPGIPNPNRDDHMLVRDKLDTYVRHKNNIVLMLAKSRDENSRLEIWAQECKGRGLAVFNCFQGDAAPELLVKMVQQTTELGIGGHLVRLRHETEAGESQASIEKKAEAALVNTFRIKDDARKLGFFQANWGVDKLTLRLQEMYQTLLRTDSHDFETLLRDVQRQKSLDEQQLKTFEAQLTTPDKESLYDSWCSNLSLRYLDLLRHRTPVLGNSSKTAGMIARRGEELEQMIVPQVDELSWTFADEVRERMKEYLKQDGKGRAKFRAILQQNAGYAQPPLLDEVTVFHDMFKDVIPRLEEPAVKLVDSVEARVSNALCRLIWHEASHLDYVVPDRYRAVADRMQDEVKAFCRDQATGALRDALKLVHSQAQYGIWNPKFDHAIAKMADRRVSEEDGTGGVAASNTPSTVEEYPLQGTASAASLSANKSKGFFAKKKRASSIKGEEAYAADGGVDDSIRDEAPGRLNSEDSGLSQVAHDNDETVGGEIQEVGQQRSGPKTPLVRDAVRQQTFAHIKDVHERVFKQAALYGDYVVDAFIDTCIRLVRSSIMAAPVYVGPPSAPRRVPKEPTAGVVVAEDRLRPYLRRVKQRADFGEFFKEAEETAALRRSLVRRIGVADSFLKECALFRSPRPSS